MNEMIQEEGKNRVEERLSLGLQAFLAGARKMGRRRRQFMKCGLVGGYNPVFVLKSLNSGVFS